MDVVRKNVHIDPRRVYLTGFSAGGRLTFTIAVKHPHIFRGIAPLCAPFDTNKIPANVNQFQDLRVYISHGALETNISSDAKSAAGIFQKLGSTVKYVSYEGIAHDLPKPINEELARILNFLDYRE